MFKSPYFWIFATTLGAMLVALLCDYLKPVKNFPQQRASPERNRRKAEHA